MHHGQLEFYHDFRMVFGFPLLRPTSECMKYSDLPRQCLILINSYFVILEITMPDLGPLCKAGLRDLGDRNGVV